MGNANKKGPVWFMKPNPCLLPLADLKPYMLPGEKQPPAEDVLLPRVYELIVNDPTGATHRIIFAVLTIRLKRDSVMKDFAELEKLVEAAIQCDANLSKSYSVLGYLLEKTGDVKRAGEVYLKGYHRIYAVGGRMLDIADVELLALFAAFGEANGIPLPLPLGDIWKDCCLRAPNAALANGNYGLFLLRNGHAADAKPRLEKARDLENDPEGFWANQLASHFPAGKKGK
jgi:tetratricopeptide (TPR) repeat protein